MHKQDKHFVGKMISHTAYKELSMQLAAQSAPLVVEKIRTVVPSLPPPSDVVLAPANVPSIFSAEEQRIIAVTEAVMMRDYHLEHAQKMVAAASEELMGYPSKYALPKFKEHLQERLPPAFWATYTIYLSLDEKDPRKINVEFWERQNADDDKGCFIVRASDPPR